MGFGKRAQNSERGEPTLGLQGQSELKQTLLLLLKILRFSAPSIPPGTTEALFLKAIKLGGTDGHMYYVPGAKRYACSQLHQVDAFITPFYRTGD